ncbi:hypothetical protein EGW08_012702, partial [Elysia chlorotica]
LRVPSENFKVSDVKQCVGIRRVLDVMDVTTQKAMEMSMKEWVKYYENPERDRLLNVISLEFCHTRLENYVESPTLVRQVDWVDRAWPRHLKECQTESTNVIERMKYPKVQKYCLMSVAGCYTDFHIDFGGTSVWYHILHGEKIFWLAPPSQKNIDRYVEWTLSAKQGESFLGDTLECCQRIQLLAGHTFIIPSGWIHAVYTPKDSLVFGGNFLHSFNVENQLLVSRVEDKTYVPSKFKYPFYQEIMWYVVDRYLSCLTGRTYLSAASSDKDDGYDEDDQGLIHVDEDSRPPSRNPDSQKEEEPPKISKSVTIELTRIDAAAMKRSPSEDENQPPASAQGRPRGPRKAASDPNNSWEGGGPRKWVNLTATELKGVNQLIDYLSGLLTLPVSKRGVPKDLLDPEAVLKELRQVLEEHRSDDQGLSISGEPVIGWPELNKKLKLGYKTYKTAKGARGNQTPPSSSSSSSNVQRRRRTRCKKCEACTRTECGECTFCKDMKKFGGPGRMKQTCISRQCMAPVLPSASVCMLCNQGDQSNCEDPDDVSSSLMECGICWEIVHPKCLRKKYDSLESEGVVNEDLPNSWECLKCCNEGKQGQLKMEDSSFQDSEGSQEEGEGGPLSPISPIEGKRVTAKEGSVKCEFGTPIKWANSLKQFSPMSDSNIKKEADGRSPSSPSLQFGDENVHKKNSSHSANHKEQKKMVKREKFFPGVPSHGGRAAAAVSSPYAAIAGAQLLSSPAPVLPSSSSSSSSPLLHKSGPVGIAPLPLSLPLSSSTPSSHSVGAVAGGHLESCHDGSRFVPSRGVKKEEDSGGSGGGGGDGNPPDGPTPEKLRWGTDYAPKVPIRNYVVRPAPPLNIPEFVTLTDGGRHPLPRPLWLAVFRWLPRADLARLSSVCRTFDCWALDPALWASLDLSRCSLQPAHLRGVILRQPRALKLASSVVSFSQLSWLVARLPGLRHLDLSNLAWASIGALCSADCPLLRSLDLSWATGIRDLCFRELASPPANLKPGQRNLSRLARLERLSLTGTDINDQSLKTISLHLPRLTSLDLTCCMRVTDRGIRALVQMSSAGPCRLRELRLVKCVQLTERCLEALASCVELRYLALTDNPAISQEACVRFSRSYKHRT